MEASIEEVDVARQTSRLPRNRRPLNQALALVSETEDVDFKSHCDFSKSADQLEILKDIAAFANSGGGYILFGVDDFGQPIANADQILRSVDPAKLTDLVHKYTGFHFAGFSISYESKGGAGISVLSISAADSPIVFCRVGTYQLEGRDEKTAFRQGTTYFRHGTKSEPGCCEDLRSFIERKIEQARDHWMKGIAQVVSAPIGSTINIVPKASDLPVAIPSTKIRLSADPSVPALRAVSIDETHPFRQKELIENLKRAVGPSIRITQHHIQCVKKVMGVAENKAYMDRTNFGSPQYSREFLELLVERIHENPNFLCEIVEECRKKPARFEHDELDLEVSRIPLERARS